MAVTREQVAELYVATFNRAPDAAGLDYWVNDSGLEIEGIAQSFFDQAETQALYPVTLSNEEFVNAIYNNLFNRDAEPAGLEYWVNELESGNITKGNMILAIVNGAVDSGLGSDATILANKLEIGLAFADAGLNLVEDAKLVMDEVDHTQTSVDDALAEIAVLVDEAANIGETLTLTTSATDNILGTTFNDLIIGEVAGPILFATGVNTLQSSDVINGGEGVDTLRVTSNTDDYTDVGVAGFTMTNVENLEVRSYSADDYEGVTLDLVNVSGLEKVISTTSTGDITLDTVQNIVDLDLTGNGASGITVEVNYIDEAMVGETTQNIVVDRFEGDVYLYGDNEEVVESVNITTADRASNMGLYGDMTNVTIDGTADLSLYVDNYLSTVDASALDASLDLYVYTYADTAETASVIGTANDDYLEVNVNGNGTTTIDAGEGSNEVYAYVNDNAAAVNVTAGAGADMINVYGMYYDADATDGYSSQTTITIDAGDGDNNVYVGEDAAVVNVTTGTGADIVDIDTDVYDSDAWTYIVTPEINVAMGAGNDTIILEDNGLEDSTSTVSMGYTIDGGEGDDTLVTYYLDDVDAVAAGDDVAAFANVTSIETLEITDDYYYGDLDGDLSGANAAGVVTYDFTGFTIDTYSAVELTNVASEVTAKFNLDESDSYAWTDITISQVDTAANVANIEFDLSDVYEYGAETFYLDNVTLDSAETVNITLADQTLSWVDNTNTVITDIADEVYLYSLNSEDLTTLTVAGNLALEVGYVNAANLTLINAATMTHDVTLNYINDVAAALTINTGTGNDYIYADTTDTAYTVNSLGGNDEIYLAELADNVNSGDGDDEIYTYAGDDVINAGAGADYINAGSGIETIDAGAGDDLIEFLAADLTSADTVNGGADNDIVYVDTTGNFVRNDDFFYRWSGVETLKLSNAGNSTLEFNAIANDNGVDTVILNGGTDSITMGEGFFRDLTVVLATDGAGVTIDGSASASTLTMRGDAAMFDTTDYMFGGTGALDTINVIADNSTAVFGTAVSGFENLLVTRDATDVGVMTVGVTTSNEMVAAAATLSVTATDLDAGDTLTFDGALETDGSFNITSGESNDTITGGAMNDTINAGNGTNSVTGGAGNDTITTGTGNDIIVGGDGNDTINAGDGANTINGGAGIDTMTGGTGVDTYVFGAVTDSQGVTVDVITNFTGLVDGDVLDFSAITAAGSYTGAANGYGAVLTALTGLGNAQAVLDSSTSTLYVDVNGDAALTAADMAIQLTGVTDLTDADNFVW